MRESIKSFILLILIVLILGILLIQGLDIFGVIILPEKYSIKKFINYNNHDTVTLVSENIISYPKEYYDNKNNSNELEHDPSYSSNEVYNGTGGSLTEYIDQNQVTHNNNNNNGIVIGANNSYYYNQLNTYGKTLYNEMYKNIDNLKTGTYVIEYGTVFNDLLNTPNGEETLTDAFQLSINAMLLDHPEIFYLDVTKMYMYTEINKSLIETVYKVSIGPEEGTNYLLSDFPDQASVLIAEDELNTIAYQITSHFDGNTYNKIKQAHDYLVENLKYDEEDNLKKSHSVYGALIDKLAVCDGYAKAFKYLLDYMGIHCVQICGTAVNSLNELENHTWNYVYIENTWYAVDSTWDDPIITGGGSLTNDLKYKYFLCGSDKFFSNHTEDGYIVSNGCFAYPVISKTSYQ